MKKKINLLFCASIITVIAISILFAQSDIIKINNKSVFVDKQRSPVSFPHQKHMNSVGCKKCHHLYQDGKNVLKISDLTAGNPMIKCSTCHSLDKAGNCYGLMDAYHVQCIECHRKKNQEAQKTGPMLCGECHPGN